MMQNKRLFAILLVAGLFAALLPNVAVQANVTLSDFRAQGSANHIMLFWETATELDNFGFHLWRGQTNNLDNASRITANLIPSQVGGQPIGASYEYEDNTTQPNILYFYWLEAVDVNALSEFYGPEQGMMSNSNPLGTATPGSNEATPLPTSTLAPTNTPPPANTPPADAAAPSPTPRPPASPTPTRQPANTPPPTANAAAPDPTKIAGPATPETTLPTDAPPAAGISPTTQANAAAASPQPTAIAEVSGSAAGSESTGESAATPGDQTDAASAGVGSQLPIVGANAPLETPPATPDVASAATSSSLPPIALWGVAAGTLLSLGGILTAAALFKRRQSSK